MFDIAFTVGAAISTGITAGMGVYAALCDTRVKSADKDRKHWELRHEEARNEIHKIRDEWQADQLELAKLRVQTNFAPLEQRLDIFIESQKAVNHSLTESLNTMTLLMGKLTLLMGVLVPELKEDEEKRQEEKL